MERERERLHSQIECPYVRVSCGNPKSGPDYIVFIMILFFQFYMPRKNVFRNPPPRCLLIPQVWREGAVFRNTAVPMPALPSTGS
jgi:hypothetical protein